MKVSILIPCFNETKTIAEILIKVNEQKNILKEIIIIDDASTDGTKKKLKNELKSYYDILIENDYNQGKGYSIRKGIKFATGDVILIQDADLEYDPSDYQKVLNPILSNKADVVYGSRFSSSQEKRVLFFWHSFGNKLLTLLSNAFTNINLTDMECCFKAFKAPLLKNIKLKENRFGFEPEITAKISKKNIRIFEVGVSYYGRTYADGKKITWKDGFRALWCIIKYNLINDK